MNAPPQRIGPYTIVGVLGEGATGKVYLAEQTEPLRRTVALKVLEAIDSSARALARFDIERTALAVMDHPSIAKVFDAGITDTGHPYVVMERVDGKPIDEYCDEHRLTIRERVALFADACRAVHHAHQRGLIHRDLKPSHLLVTEIDGRPQLRIIDFGIAMAMERGGRLDVGRDDEEIVGTPGYMSPEQIEGSVDVDTRSDIYALGVILYELLVGVPPFDSGRRRGWAALAAQFRDLPTPTRRLISLDDTQETVASHRGTTPRQLRKAIYEDLDSIVAKAMATDRARRYQTAQELWLDLERYLHYEPVEAVDGGGVYRARKFARRHRVGAGFGVVVALGLVAIATNFVVQARRVAVARDEAALRRSQAEGLIDFMLSDLKARLEPLGRLDLLDAVGERALDYLAATPERFVTDEDLFRRVTTLQLIGQVRDGQGDLQAAREAYERSLALNLDLVGRAPDNTDWLFGLGQAQYYVGSVDYGVGDYDAALEHFQSYLAISEDLARRDSTNLAWQGELAYSYSNIGSVRQRQGQLDAALEQFAQSKKIWERLVQADSSNSVWRSNLADTHDTMGDLLRAQGQLAEARGEFTEEVRIKQELVDADPSDARVRARLATAHNYLGQSLQSMGEEDPALAQFRSAIDLWTELTRLDSTNAQWRRNLAVNQERVANILAGRGDLVGSLARLFSAEEVLRLIADADPTDPGRASDVAQVDVDLARVLRRAGRRADALSRTQSAQATLDGLIQQTPSNRELLRIRAEALDMLGALRADAGDSLAARQAWTTAEEVVGPLAEASADPRFVTPWARALLHLGRVDDARPVVRRLERIGYRNDDLAELAAGKGLANSLGV